MGTSENFRSAPQHSCVGSVLGSTEDRSAISRWNRFDCVSTKILLMGLFKRGGYIRGVQRLRLLLQAHRVCEPAELTIFRALPIERPLLVTFEGDKNHFADL